jgi:hypothetical protein
MPHYKDGTPVELGDIVKGTGYYVKHEIIGVVLSVNPKTEQCNLSVAHLEVIRGPEQVGEQLIAMPAYFGEERKTVFVKISTEYGQTDAFEKIG